MDEMEKNELLEQSVAEEIEERAAEETETAETIVEIHYADLGMPTIEGRVSGEWITGTTDTTKVTVNSDYDFRYSVNGSDWKYVDITTDEKTIEQEKLRIMEGT